MAFPEYPATLPSAIFHSFDTELTSGLLNPDEVLYPVENRLFPDYRKRVELILTDAQYTIFRAWVVETLYGGGAAFDLTNLNIGHETENSSCDSLGRIVMPYTAKRISDLPHWQIKFDLEIIYIGI